MDSMMVTTNPVQDPTSNFAPVNPPLGHENDPYGLIALAEATAPAQDYHLSIEYIARKRAESVSRKYRRAQHALEAAIKDLKATGFWDAGYETLEGALAEVKEHRESARIIRTVKLSEYRTAQETGNFTF